MAVHYSSNVILLAIEYFIDSKGEIARKTKYKTFINLKQLFLPELEVQNTLLKEAKGWSRHGV